MTRKPKRWRRWRCLEVTAMSKRNLLLLALMLFGMAFVMALFILF